MHLNCDKSLYSGKAFIIFCLSGFLCTCFCWLFTWTVWHPSPSPAEPTARSTPSSCGCRSLHHRPCGWFGSGHGSSLGCGAGWTGKDEHNITWLIHQMAKSTQKQTFKAVGDSTENASKHLTTGQMIKSKLWSETMWLANCRSSDLFCAGHTCDPPLWSVV